MLIKSSTNYLVAEIYKMKDKVKLSDTVINNVEHEIEWASKRYFNDLEWKQKNERYSFFYGQQ